MTTETFARWTTACLRGLALMSPWAMPFTLVPWPQTPGRVNCDRVVAAEPDEPLPEYSVAR
jgi:hypothetical protein